MVWWVDKYTPSPNVCRSGSLCFYKSQDPNEEDRTFPSLNIMFNFNRPGYTPYDMYSLIKSGVNIFNIDRTENSEEFFEETVSSLLKAKGMPEMIPLDFYVPITVAVTMSIDDPVPIKNMIDVVVLKNVHNLDQYLNFKRSYRCELNQKSILLWLTKWDGEEVEQLIKFSDGVILDHEREHSEEYCECALNFSKKYFKSVFYIKPSILEEYYSLDDRDLRIIRIINKTIKNQIDGIIIIDNGDVELPPRDIIRSIVRGISFAEQQLSPEEDYFDKSFKIKTPVLPYITAALAASLAALKLEADAIFVFTKSGTSARWCAHTSPPCPIVAITTEISTTRRLHLYRKVMPLLYIAPRAASWQVEWWNRVHFGTTFSLKTGLFTAGAKLVVLAPSEEGINYCNSFQIFTLPFKCDF